MSATKFQVGDRVNFISCRDSDDWSGRIVGTIRKLCLPKVAVAWDTAPAESRRYYAEDLYLVNRPRDLPNVNAGNPVATLPLDSAARKEIPLHRGLLRYFPAALAWTARISKLGNQKHNAGEEMHHARGKSSDHADCILRHMMDLDADYGKGVGRDENGVPQVGYIVWRALALAQEWLEANDGAPFSPGARKAVAK